MKHLTPEQKAQFLREGYVPKIRVLSEKAANEARTALEDYEKRSGGPLRGNFRHKSHLLFPFLLRSRGTSACSMRSRTSTARTSSAGPPTSSSRKGATRPS